MSSSRRILVVDDDPTVLINLIAHLEDEGYAVLSAVDGESALGVLAQEPQPDLAVVDIRLAGMNGEEFIPRAHAVAPRMRCLVRTGTSEHAASAALSEIGITERDVIRKPLGDMRVLRDAINDVLVTEGSHNEC
jgi:CheY-like chemotaxis protein